MRPTETLMNEHRLIEKILVSLESLAVDAEEGTPDAKQAGDILDFLRGFADRCHHGKEEKHLFPRLGLHGYGPETGPVAVMLNEHEAGRAYIREMAAAREAGDARGFAAAAHGYVVLLHGHIAKEDQILFRIADSVFTEEDQREVADGFERVEAEEMGAGTHETYLKIAEDLSKRYGVAATATAAPAGHSHCGHAH